MHILKYCSPLLKIPEIIYAQSIKGKRKDKGICSLRVVCECTFWSDYHSRFFLLLKIPEIIYAQSILIEFATSRTLGIINILYSMRIWLRNVSLTELSRKCSRLRVVCCNAHQSKQMTCRESNLTPLHSSWVLDPKSTII
jgi:hypothetical protein